MKKEKILIIGPKFPAYDQSSGELRLFTIIKILSAKYKIVYLDTEKWGCTDRRYRDEMEKLQVKVYTEKDASLKKIFQDNKFIAVWMEFYYTAEYYLPRVRILQPECPVIIDTVDVHFYRLRLKYNLTKNPEDLKEAGETLSRELSVYKKADLVITVTQEDADILKKEISEIRIGIIPNIHDIVPSLKEKKDKNKLIFIGSFQHKPNVDAVQYFCQKVMPLLKDRLPKIDFNVIGANPPEELKKFEGEHIHFLGFVPSVAPCLHESYISVAPLRYGAGMKGKIGEAMAHGVPVITTSIGIQGMDLRHKENIMVADQPEKYADCIVELLSNDNLYKKIAENAVEYIKINFTQEQIKRDIDIILGDIQAKSVKCFSLKEKICFYIKYITERVTGICLCYRKL